MIIIEFQLERLVSGTKSIIACNILITKDADDYNSGPYIVMITAGKINATLDIQIINDTIHEGSESFTLTIMKTSLPSRVSRGSPSMATVTIVDTTGEFITVICSIA